jgi:hypothetical protein
MNITLLNQMSKVCEKRAFNYKVLAQSPNLSWTFVIIIFWTLRALLEPHKSNKYGSLLAFYSANFSMCKSWAIVYHQQRSNQYSSNRKSNTTL